MKSNRRNRIRKASVRKHDDPVPPTRQTAAKLKADTIRRLYLAGRLDSHHAQAARQIRRVFEAVGRGMFPALRPDRWTGAPAKRRTGRDFLDGMTEHERHLWQNYYLPWSHELAVEIAAGLAGVRWLQLVIDVVVENRTLREVEQTYGLGRGRGFDYVVAGLDRYARHAGLV